MPLHCHLRLLPLLPQRQLILLLGLVLVTGDAMVPVARQVAKVAQPTITRSLLD